VTAPAESPALQLKGVRKSFRRETGETVRALDNISFSVGKGGLAALAGPDGAGKTTLLRLLAGLMKADGGIVSVLGIDAARDPQAIQSRISYMPQQFGLYDDLTVQENLNLYADLHGITAEDKRTQYPRLMEMTGLDPFIARLAGQLSGVEGYTESIATGLLAGIYAAALARGEEPVPVPRASGLGSLVHYITHADVKDFQPANITFDLLEPLEEELRKKVRDKKERHRLVCERSLAAFDAWWAKIPHPAAELRP